MKRINKESISYLLESLGILIGVILISIASCLHTVPIIIIGIYAALIIPLIIKAWIKQNKNYERFTTLCNYLTNIIPIFMQRTKIRFTLGELYEICDGDIKEVIGKAIEYIDNTKDDPNLLANGLKIIEKEFPNSRVKSVHKFLLSVENTNSTAYKEIAENLYNDIEKWIKRTYAFQKDIKDRRNKIIILCAITLIMNVMFVFIYVSNEYFKGFVDIIYYQISSTIFIGIVLLVIAIIVVRLNGEWLIDDEENKEQEFLKKKYRLYKKGKQKINIVDILLCLICLALAVYLYTINKIPPAIGLIALAYILLSQKARSYLATKKYLIKELTIEFPIWLREVSLSLGSLTVINAIEKSIEAASYPMRREVRNFLDEVKKNPSSIKAYNEFLSEYQIDEVKSSMRVLYAINNVSKSEMKERVAKLIDRNQELLTKSETIRNNDSIGGIEMIGYLPTLIFSIQMMASMIIMFNYMMQVLGGQVKL